MPTVKRFRATIRDAKRDLVIHVKPVDIKGAICKDHQRCVVAKAILRQQRSTAQWVDVGNCVVLIGRGPRTGERYHLRGSAKAAIRFFDENDGRFAPCDVHLKSPLVSGHRPLGTRAHGGGKDLRKKRRRVINKPTR